jgi:hypothetical protein
MSEKKSSDDPKKVTPEKWSSPEDARKNESAGKYPNYYSHKTRSGHVIMMDDSNGAEHVTIQHRGGSMLQFMPDGCVQFVSHNGQYNIIFGESRILVTGAQDVYVQGDASVRVEGNYNITVKGDTNLDVNGDFNVTAKNFNQVIRGNMDIEAKNKTEKIEGSSTSQAQGSMSLISEAGMTVGSSGDALALGGATMIGMVSPGDILIKSGSDTSIKSDSGIKLEGAAKISVKSDTMIAMDASPIKLNKGASEPAKDANQVFRQSAARIPSKEPDTPIDV